MWRSLRQGERRRLTWRERKVQSDAPKHALRMLPLLANPLPPPFGLVLIGVAATMPRTLLTPQFWTEGQCYAFARQDSDATRRRHAKLPAELAKTTASGDGTGDTANSTRSSGDLDVGDLGSVADASGFGAACSRERREGGAFSRDVGCVPP